MDELDSKIALMWSLNTGFLLKRNRILKSLRVVTVVLESSKVEGRQYKQ